MQIIHTLIGADRNEPVHLTNDLQLIVRESSWYNDMPGEAIFSNLEEGI